MANLTPLHDIDENTIRVSHNKMRIAPFFFSQW
jgi:hypothetical protein